MLGKGFPLLIVLSVVYCLPIHIYVPGVVGIPDVFCTCSLTGDLSTLYISGTLGLLNDTLPPVLVPGGAGISRIHFKDAGISATVLILEAPETQQIMENIKYILEYVCETYLGSQCPRDVLDTIISCSLNIRDAEKTTFKAVNEVYKGYFNGNPPSRISTAGVTIALGAAVEITCIASF